MSKSDAPTWEQFKEAIDWLFPVKLRAPVLIGTASALCLCFTSCYVGSKFKIADGYRDSTVRKVSETGIVYKTWEAESLGDAPRVTGDSQNGWHVGAETFQYTVRNPAIIEKLRAIPPGKRVRIHYTKYLSTWELNGESRYEITAIEPIPE